MVSTLLSLQNGYQCRFYFQRECKTGCKVTKKAVKEKHPMAQAAPESDFLCGSILSVPVGYQALYEKTIQYFRLFLLFDIDIEFL